MRPPRTYRAARRDGARRALQLAKAAGEKTDWRAVWRDARDAGTSSAPRAEAPRSGLEGQADEPDPKDPAP